MGATCGALTGAVMAVGLEVGRTRLEDTEQYAKAMVPAQEVYRRFEAAEGSSRCLEIHERLYGRSFLLADPEQRNAFLEAGGHTATGCPGVCCEAAKIAADVILALREKQE